MRRRSSYCSTVALNLIALFCLSVVTQSQRALPHMAQTARPQGAGYFPPRGDAWRRKRPEEVGMDAALLGQAIAYAKTQESKVLSCPLFIIQHEPQSSSFEFARQQTPPAFDS